MARARSLMVSLLLSWLALMGAPSSSHATQGDILVSVNGVPISRQELEAASTERPIRTFKFGDQHKFKTLILRDMILQEIAKQLMTEEELAKNPALKRKIELNRRSLLFDAYIQKRLPATAAISVPETEKFIAEHPEFFQDRRMYHFGELIIEAKSETQVRAIQARLKLLSELKEPSPEQFEAVAQWAMSNAIGYGVLKDWTPTEKLPHEFDKIILTLDKRVNKVQIDSKNFDFRAIVLFASYPDPINPLFAKNSVAQRLAKEFAEKKTVEIVSDMLARANVVLYDKEFKDLNLPKKLAPFQKNEPSKLTDRLFFGWNFALFILIPASLFHFFRQKTPDYEDSTLSYFEHFSHEFIFRLGFVATVGSLMFLLAGIAILRNIDPYDTKNLAIAAVGGLVGGGALVLSIAAIPGLRRAFASRWSAIFVVAAAQMVLMLTLGPEFT
jgi:EpsD family peptidyl-prolyl cis-trans isomerase